MKKSNTHIINHCAKAFAFVLLSSSTAIQAKEIKSYNSLDKPTNNQVINKEFPTLSQQYNTTVQLAAMRMEQHNALLPPGILEDTTIISFDDFIANLSKEDIKQYQKPLDVLGFPLGYSGVDGISGRMTKQAFEDASFYYGPLLTSDDKNQILSPADKLEAIKEFAKLAKIHAEQYNVETDVAASIWLAHKRTGVNFEYLMELAFVETSFRPDVEAKRSSATGLYQFIDSTWLDVILRFGEKYGLEHYAKQIEFRVNEDDKLKPTIDDPKILKEVLELRKSPHLAALMAAELTIYNKNAMHYLKNIDEPSRVDLYMAHLFGIADAMTFKRGLKYQPDEPADKMFPDLARYNPGVFYKSKEKQSYKNIQEHFEGKFNLNIYNNPTQTIVSSLKPPHKLKI